MAKRYGGKNTLGLSFLLWTPLSAVLAASTRSGYAVAVVITCRLGIGLAQGIFLPAAHSVLGHWTPPNFRGQHFALAFSGFFAGAAIAMTTVPRTGALCVAAEVGGGHNRSQASGKVGCTRGGGLCATESCCGAWKRATNT